VLNGDSLSYCADANYNGKDTIIYQICDGLGGCDIDTVFITVNPVNDDPDADTDYKTTNEDVCVNIDVQVNDTDPDGDVLTTTIVTNALHGTGTVLVGNDSISYCPNNGYNGNDTIIYQVCDGNGGCDIDTVFININSVNNDPVADTDYKTVNEDNCINIDVQVNDVDPDGDALTTSIITNAPHGTAGVLNGDSLSYCPDANYNGKDTIIYQICDGLGGCDIDTVFITVNPVNDDPDANTDKKTTNKNVCIMVKVQINDNDPDGDNLTSSILNNANFGAGTLVNGDSILYCPNNNYVGKDTLIYEICDGNGGCDQDTIIITVLQVLDPFVVAVDDTLTIYANDNTSDNYIIDIQKNDTDYNGGYLTSVIFKDPTSGGQITVINGDSVMYKAPNGFFGKDTIQYIVCSSLGADLNDCDTAYIFITVIAADCDKDGIADWNDNAKDCEFFIPEGFSPNGDGVNDTWFIRGILDYPKNHVQIFNRWGNLVFETDGYKNDWNGTTIFGLTIGGNDLPEGTYFYIVDLGNNTKVYKGYVYLKR
jgi:gliding motility-associated-like protein